MKAKQVVSICLAGSLLVTGCGASADGSNARGNSVDSAKSVNEVLIEQISDAQTEATTEASALPSASTNVSQGTPDPSVDIDTTVMDADMVYATVYQFMLNPDAYEGKTVKISGTYLPYYYEVTNTTYQYCLIADAMACCSQGLEFIWGDGSHVYPDDYPAENTPIIVTGTFETYFDSDQFEYCRLSNATLTLASSRGTSMK